MENQNLIHVKFEYGEALNAKKQILSSQMRLLRIAQLIGNYKKIRLKKLRTNLKTYRKIKELKKELSNLHQVLPKVKIPRIIKKEPEEKKVKEIPLAQTQYDKGLETELQEIQEKLNKLQRQTERF